jgi:hypothetical protein
MLANTAILTKQDEVEAEQKTKEAEHRALRKRVQQERKQRISELLFPPELLPNVEERRVVLPVLVQYAGSLVTVLRVEEGKINYMR